MPNFLRIIAHIRPYSTYAGMNVFFNVLAILFSLVSLTMIIPFLRILFDIQKLVLDKPNFSFSVEWLTNYFNYTLSQLMLQYGKIEALLLVCLLVIVVFFLKNFFRYAAVFMMAVIRNGVVKDIRNQLFNRILHLPIAYFTEQRKGDMMTRVTNDVQEIEWSIMSVLEALVRDPITIITYLAALFFISPKLTLFVLFVLPITGGIIGKIGKTLKKQSHQAQTQLGILLSIIDETLSGLRIIKGFNAQQMQQQKFVQSNQKHFQIMKNMLRRRDLSAPLSEFLSICVVATVLYVGGRMVLTHSIELEAETFIYFMVIFSQILSPAKSFSKAFYNIQKGMASVERVYQIIDTPDNIHLPAKPLTIKDFTREIEFKNVQFAYGNQPVLHNINFTLKKGETIALVGASGAGKSTIADLIPRFYDVNNGSILLDGNNIQQYHLEDLRQLMGIVTQEAILFNDSIFNNITVGIERQVSDSEVVEAAKIANAHDFIMQLPEGYQSLIGDRGCKLSGGERQRLTIARAVLKNPPILILDEATSSLDSVSEKLVQEALFKLMQNRTSIIIAHRLSTIQFADKILVLNKGKIVEGGTHETLMAKKDGHYRKLVQLQEMQG